MLNDEAHHAYRIRRDGAGRGRGGCVRRRGRGRGVLQGSDGLDRRTGPHPQAARHQLLRRPLGDALLPRPGGPGDEPAVPVGRERLRADRRHRVGPGEDPAARRARHDRRGRSLATSTSGTGFCRKLTPAERGGKQGNPKPEAILKYAHTPIAMLGGLWEKSCERMGEGRGRPAAAGLHPRLQEHEDRQGDLRVAGRGQAARPAFRRPRSRASATRTARSTRSASIPRWSTRRTPARRRATKSRWMRFTLDTVGKHDWPRDRQGRPIYPEGFEELAKKLERPLHPPGRDVRCIVSVGMLTEGWDCNTVTHIVGLRPFMSQLLCEQVVGPRPAPGQLRRGRGRQVHRGSRQGLRRAVRGHSVQGEQARAGQPPRRSAITSTPCRRRREFEIRFPRVEGYTQAIRNRVTVDWDDASRRWSWTRCRFRPKSRSRRLHAEQPGPAVADRAGPVGRRDAEPVSRGPAAAGAGLRPGPRR